MVHGQLIDKILWLVRRRMRCRIEGNSMRPSYSDGDIVYFRAVKRSKIKQGEAVLFRHPFQSILVIKRIAEVTEDGSCYVLGDNQLESSDSRSFGRVSTDRILGVVCG